MTSEVETGVTLLQAKEGRVLTATTRSEEETRKESTLQIAEGAGPYGLFWTSGLQSCETVVFSVALCYSSPRKLIM